MTTYYLHTAADLAAAVRDLRPDAIALGIEIAADWARDQMHALGITRYEDVDQIVLHAIADRVDQLAEADAIDWSLVEIQAQEQAAQVLGDGDAPGWRDAGYRSAEDAAAVLVGDSLNGIPHDDAVRARAIQIVAGQLEETTEPETRTCAQCGTTGPVAEDQSDPCDCGHARDEHYAAGGCAAVTCHCGRFVLAGTRTCAQCGTTGPVAEDQTDVPADDELVLDSRGLVRANEYVCGACLAAAE